MNNIQAISAVDWTLWVMLVVDTVIFKLYTRKLYNSKNKKFYSVLKNFEKLEKSHVPRQWSESLFTGKVVCERL